MSDEKYEIVGVRSNVDRLSVEAVHDLLSDMVSRSIEAGADWLRLIAPEGETMALKRAIDVREPFSDVASGDIEAAVGIPPIVSAAGRGSPDYPLFVDQGTGLFGPRHDYITPTEADYMVFDGAGGYTFFVKETKGQKPQEFMLSTYEQITRIALPIEEELFARRVKDLWMDPMTSPVAIT